MVDLGEEVRQYQRLHAGALGNDRVVLVVPARGTIRRRRRRATEVVIHVDQDVAAPGQLHDVVGQATVARVA